MNRKFGARIPGNSPSDNRTPGEYTGEKLPAIVLAEGLFDDLNFLTTEFVQQISEAVTDNELDVMNRLLKAKAKAFDLREALNG